MLQNKVLLITGGTGSFGNAVIKRFLNTDHFREIRIFSRDEKKQDDMRRLYNNNKIKFYIGDIRDSESVKNAVKNIDFILDNLVDFAVLLGSDYGSFVLNTHCSNSLDILKLYIFHEKRIGQIIKLKYKLIINIRILLIRTKEIYIY
jgi:NAD(P)-dependent dehydrogenase (short-subunit alcohol dehydrogenase family)